jgi:hypothetical protein
MSNNPILPIVPTGAALAGDGKDNDEDELPVNNPDLGEGESNDSQDEVERDLKEGNSVNSKLGD